MHGSRVYKPFGMRNGCHIHVNNDLYTRCTAAVYINFLAWATAAVRLVVLYRISFGSRVYHKPLPKISMFIRTAKDFQPKITSAFDNAVGICLKC